MTSEQEFVDVLKIKIWQCVFNKFGPIPEKLDYSPSPLHRTCLLVLKVPVDGWTHTVLTMTGWTEKTKNFSAPSLFSSVFLPWADEDTEPPTKEKILKTYEVLIEHLERMASGGEERYEKRTI